MHISGIVLLLSLIGAACNTGVIDREEYRYGQLHPSAPGETYQWGKMVGEWDCTTYTLEPDSTWTKGKAEWAFRYAVDGFGIEDVWYVAGKPEAQIPDFTGVNYRMYDPQKEAWVCYWAEDNSQALYGPWPASYHDGALTMTVLKNRRKIIFHDITDSTFLWRNEVSSDSGKTWRVNFRIEGYKKALKASEKNLFDRTISPSGPDSFAVEQTKEFDQLVGTWECVSEDLQDDGSWTTSLATWDFSYALSGRAIRDVWHEREEDKTNNTATLGRDFSGLNFRIYNPHLEHWQCLWMDNRDNTISGAWQAVYDLEAGTITMNDSSQTWRVTFFDITDHTFAWRYEVLNGEIWTETSRIRARRKLHTMPWQF